MKIGLHNVAPIAAQRDGNSNEVLSNSEVYVNAKKYFFIAYRLDIDQNEF